MTNTKRRWLHGFIFGALIGGGMTGAIMGPTTFGLYHKAKALKFERDDAWLLFIYNTYQTGIQLHRGEVKDVQRNANDIISDASSKIVGRINNSVTYRWWLDAMVQYAEICNIDIDKRDRSELARLERESVFGSGGAFEDHRDVVWHDEAPRKAGRSYGK